MLLCNSFTIITHTDSFCSTRFLFIATRAWVESPKREPLVITKLDFFSCWHPSQYRTNDIKAQLSQNMLNLHLQQKQLVNATIPWLHPSQRESCGVSRVSWSARWQPGSPAAHSFHTGQCSCQNNSQGQRHPSHESLYKVVQNALNGFLPQLKQKTTQLGEGGTHYFSTFSTNLWKSLTSLWLRLRGSRPLDLLASYTPANSTRMGLLSPSSYRGWITATLYWLGYEVTCTTICSQC